MALKYSYNQTNVAVISDGEYSISYNEIEGNVDLIGFTFNLLKPEIVLSQNFKELVTLIKESSPVELTEEEISKLLSKPRETTAKLAYIIVSKAQGTIFGFVIDGAIQPLVIPRYSGIDCLIEVMTAINDDAVSYYVDCTNRRIFTPDQVGRLGNMIE